MSLKAKVGAGAKFEAELYRKGKLVPDEKKAKKTILLSVAKGEIVAIGLKPFNPSEGGKDGNQNHKTEDRSSKP